jgi:hypothetical protein
MAWSFRAQTVVSVVPSLNLGCGRSTFVQKSGFSYHPAAEGKRCTIISRPGKGWKILAKSSFINLCMCNCLEKHNNSKSWLLAFESKLLFTHRILPAPQIEWVFEGGQ